MRRGVQATVVHHYTKREVTLTGSELTTARKWRLIPSRLWALSSGEQVGFLARSRVPERASFTKHECFTLFYLSERVEPDLYNTES